MELEKEKIIKKVSRELRWASAVFFIVLLSPIGFYVASKIDFSKEVVQEVHVAVKKQEVVNGIDVETGLIAAEGYEIVKGTCGACHSLALVTQNKATREGWKDIIVWMQETQKLWDLGGSEEIILDYLEKNYSPKEQGRRAPLKNIDWYEL